MPVPKSEQMKGSANHCRFVPMEFEHCGEMSSLMNRHYERQRPVSYFEWQYFDCPTPVVSIGAFAGDKLVGLFGLQSKPMGSGQSIDQVIDILVDEDHRGRGLFVDMWKKACSCLQSRGAQMVLANPNGKEACVRKLNFQVVAQIESLSVQPSQLGSVTDLFRLPAPGGAGRLKMSRSAFDWRFSRHPLFHYQQFGDFEESVLVTKVFRTDTTAQGDIVYYHGPVLHSLWQEACQALASQGVEQINCWAVSGTQERDLLEHLGFQIRPQERFLCVKSDAQDLLHSSAWNIVQADTEHF